MALADNLVCYFKCDEASGNLLDAHGSFTLTDTGSIGTTTGKINGGRTFNGSSQYATSGSAPLTDVPLTMTAWVNMADFGTDTVVGIGDLLGLHEFVIYTSGGTVTVLTQNGGSHNEAVSSTNVGSGTWRFVAGVWTSSSDRRVFVDGTKEATDTNTLAIGGTPTALVVGQRANLFGGQDFNGSIDEIGVWSRALADSEITTLYNSGSGTSYASITGGGGATSVPRRLALLGVGT